MASIIYFDNNATTKPLACVAEAVATVLREEYANPSSAHFFGQRVRHRLETARQQVAALIGAEPREMVFTSGGTESINLAIVGTLRAHPGRRHLVTSAVEHNAVVKVCERLGREGFEIQTVGVDSQGRLDLAELEAALRDDTALVSLIHVNNETGVLFPIEQVAEICDRRNVPLHVDAVQSAGKIPIDVRSAPISLLSLSGHKLHGPKGAGALFVRRRTRIDAMLPGTQERQLRGGTENVAGIVGLGVACAEAAKVDDAQRRAIAELRDRLEQGVCRTIDCANVIGAEADRIHNTTNIAFESLEAEAILILLSEVGVCASAGSACSSGSLEPSHVLEAMGIESRLAHGAVRFSLSRFNTSEEVDRVVELLPGVLSRLTSLVRR